MPDYPTYRVYTPSDLQTFSPSTLRTAPRPQERVWMGITFVILFGLVISGASFAALRYLNVDLTSSRASLAGMPATTPAPAPAVVELAPSPIVTPAAVAAGPQAETSADHTAKVRHRPVRHRRVKPAAGALPPSVPPNPF